MNRENYKTKRQGRPKRNRKAAKIKEWTLDPTQKLRQDYSTKIEWAIKKLPKIKEK